MKSREFVKVGFWKFWIIWKWFSAWMGVFIDFIKWIVEHGQLLFVPNVLEQSKHWILSLNILKSLNLNGLNDTLKSFHSDWMLSEPIIPIKTNSYLVFWIGLRSGISSAVRSLGNSFSDTWKIDISCPWRVAKWRATRHRRPETALHLNLTFGGDFVGLYCWSTSPLQRHWKPLKRHRRNVSHKRP